VSQPEKERRVAVLLDVEKRKQADFAASFIGKPVTVLLETMDDDGSGLGWTGEYVPARIAGSDLHPNQIVRYTVEEVRNGRVFGRKASHEDAE
jgi:tRNA A37 methylthiotransferase MiaB